MNKFFRTGNGVCRATLGAIFVLFSSTFMSGSAIAQQSSCREVRDIQVVWSEEHEAGLSPQDLRRAATPGALREAVQRAVGFEIRSLTSIRSKLENERYEEAVREIAFQRIQGLVQSYDVIDEQRRPTPGGRQEIVLKIAARVCIPDVRDLPVIVAIGAFTSGTGGEDPQLAAVAQAALPAERILVSAKAPGAGYSDVVVTGRLSGPELIHDDRSAAKGALEGYIGRPVGLAGSDSL